MSPSLTSKYSAFLMDCENAVIFLDRFSSRFVKGQVLWSCWSFSHCSLLIPERQAVTMPYCQHLQKELSPRYLQPFSLDLAKLGLFVFLPCLSSYPGCTTVAVVSNVRGPHWTSEPCEPCELWSRIPWTFYRVQCCCGGRHAVEPRRDIQAADALQIQPGQSIPIGMLVMILHPIAAVADWTMNPLWTLRTLWTYEPPFEGAGCWRLLGTMNSLHPVNSLKGLGNHHVEVEVITNVVL